ncbi:MAG: BsuBI/PstI family type II restriction endonuclease [Acidobacteriota bacterium]
MIPKWLLGQLPSIDLIKNRIGVAIPEVAESSRFIRREMGAKTVFVMLYGYALEGSDVWIRPTAVTDMTDKQSIQQNAEVRRLWLERVQGPKRPRNVERRWYSENTREPIRDETLRTMVELGVAVERSGLPTTSPKPRYALALDFAELLNPGLNTGAFEELAEKWRQRHLSAATIARSVLIRHGAGGDGDHLLIKLPNGEARKLAPGPSAILTRAVVEEFAPRFLEKPAVALISESARKVSYQDEATLSAIRLSVDSSRTLPDLILIDLQVDPPLLVFVECVASDGPIDAKRRKDLEALAQSGGFKPGRCAFVTVFLDRSQALYRSFSGSLAWNSFVWFAAEPDSIISLRQISKKLALSLSKLMSI